MRVDGIDATLLHRWCAELEIHGEINGSGVVLGADTVRNRLLRTLLLTRKAVHDARMTPERIDYVLLAGTTRIPLVRQLLEATVWRAQAAQRHRSDGVRGAGAAIAAARIPGIICQQELEINDEYATECNKCKSPLLARIHCPLCGYDNAMGAGQCANPEKLSTCLPTADARAHDA